MHHHVPKTKLGKRLREQHMRHHFQDHRYGYGVSSPLWDVVFRTLPQKPAALAVPTLHSRAGNCLPSVCLTVWNEMRAPL